MVNTAMLCLKACLTCAANCEQMRGHPGSHSQPTPSRKEEKGLHVVHTAAVQRKGQNLKSADMKSK